MEVLDQFAAFGKDLQVTEFDINIPDEQIQADYTRDFLTLCFSHPAVKGFLMWGFWEGAHWLPRGAMIRKDWTKKPNYDVWNDLLFHQWWTDVSGATGADGIFRARGFLGDYEVDVTVNGDTRTIPLTVQSNAEPAYATTGMVSTPEKRHDVGHGVIVPKVGKMPAAGSTPVGSPLQSSAAASSRIQ
jgi:endo-1,4-beta-xylanase